VVKAQVKTNSNKYGTTALQGSAGNNDSYVKKEKLGKIGKGEEGEYKADMLGQRAGARYVDAANNLVSTYESSKDVKPLSKNVRENMANFMARKESADEIPIRQRGVKAARENAQAVIKNLEGNKYGKYTTQAKSSLKYPSYAGQSVMSMAMGVGKKGK
jgi:hypothetical protein